MMADGITFPIYLSPVNFGIDSNLSSFSTFLRPSLYNTMAPTIKHKVCLMSVFLRL